MSDINIALECFAALVMLTIYVGYRIEFSAYRQQGRLFPVLLVADILMCMFDLGAWVALKHGMFSAFLHLEDLYVIAYEAILVLFLFYIIDYISHRAEISYVTAWIGAVICAVNGFGCCIGSFYTFAPDGTVARTGLYWLGQVLGLAVVLLALGIILRYRKVLGARVALVFFLFTAVPVSVLLLRQLWTGISYMPLTISLLLIAMQNFIHVEQAQKLQRQEVQMAKDRLAIALSQIKPHFLYNTLNSIYVLCESDPSTAQQAVEDFSEYLRANLESLENEDEISFMMEMEHVRHYLRLEQLRFGPALRVVYEIGPVDFLVPPLTLQPIVENAVKHGVTKKKGGGTVRIATRDIGDWSEIVIADDGVGFDPDRPLQDEKIHVGIANVCERLRVISQAEMQIESAPGAGTTVRILIPKKRYKIGKRGIVFKNHSPGRSAAR